MRLVANTPQYWEFIRTLRNNPKVKGGFIQQQQISSRAHKEYMYTNYKDYYICLNEIDKPMGYIGVIDDDIRICTHPDYQRKGVAKFMLREIKDIYPNSTAKVKMDNYGSLDLFESAGFELKYYILERKEDDT